MTRKQVKDHAKTLAYVSIVWKGDVGEYRVAYKGLKPDRAEAMAYYSDDEEDVIGTANTMEHDYWLHVFDADKLQETINRDRAAVELSKLTMKGMGL